MMSGVEILRICVDGDDLNYFVAGDVLLVSSALADIGFADDMMKAALVDAFRQLLFSAPGEEAEKILDGLRGDVRAVYEARSKGMS